MKKPYKSSVNNEPQSLNLSKIDDIAGTDKNYRQELLGLSLKFFQDLKTNFRTFLTQQDEAKLRYMTHKAQPTLALFDTQAIKQLLQTTEEYLAQKSINLTLIQESTENMDNLCDFFIHNLKNHLD